MTPCKDCGEPFTQSRKGHATLCADCRELRRAQGERCGRAKLTEVQAREIRYTPASVTHVEIARAYKLHPSQVYRIRSHQAWRHLS
jgi:hypothetical protein